MRCGCPNCEAFMIHAEDSDDCVCPDCGHRCHACLGTNTVWSPERIAELRQNPLQAQTMMENIQRVLNPDSDEEY